MQNVGETGSYNLVDIVLSRAVYTLSRFIGVKNITRPFWNRWRAAHYANDETLTRFFKSIHSLDEWPQDAMVFLDQEVVDFENKREMLSKDQVIAELRRLSFLAHLAQWGCMQIDDVKRRAYRMARDLYIESEKLANGDRYRRISINYQGHTLWGNLHLPFGDLSKEQKIPLAVILNGMDDVKEEHLASEVMFQKAGIAALSFDGPGQGEAFLLDGIVMQPDFELSVIAAVNAVADEGIFDTDRYAISGLSWGGMWAYKVAAKDPRVAYILDLGGPINDDTCDKMPFLFKNKFCQIFGVRTLAEIGQKHEFCIDKSDLLSRVKAHVHIIHGGKDPLVPIADKRWLAEALKGVGNTNVKLTVYADGDHCCTEQCTEVRNIASTDFLRILTKDNKLANTMKFE